MYIDIHIDIIYILYSLMILEPMGPCCDRKDHAGEWRSKIGLSGSRIL